MKIEEAIKQKKFESEFQKAHINILYTANWLSQSMSPALEPLNLTWQQFNILRILRGMHPEPATIKILTQRMLDKMSNASRLVEKLKQKEMVERRECEFDRRQVDIILTEKGRAVLEVASKAVRQLTEGTFGCISEEEAVLLNNLLDRVRG
ncbi:MAG: MarR family transcriptional regulator [Saprospiraceae bacterium]